MKKIRKNLFSVSACTEKGFDVKFETSQVTIKRGEETVDVGIRQNNSMYRMFFRMTSSGVSDEANVSTEDLKVWHERFGHVGGRTLCKKVKTGLVNRVKLKNTGNIFCEPCQFGKSHMPPF